MFWDERSPNFTTKRARFQEILMRSRFVLCPRGRGTSSMRLYETLAAGRVPVIISDDWVPPRGPDWAACSLRWPEGRIEGLLEVLEERDQDWSAMSAVARREYAEYFARDVAFHRLLELYGELVESSVQPDSPAKIWSRSIRAAFIERAGSYEVVNRLRLRRHQLHVRWHGTLGIASRRASDRRLNNKAVGLEHLCSYPGP